MLLDGREVRGPGPDRGMVFQSYTLFPWLTVAQNIAFGLREKGMSEAQSKDIVSAYIDNVGLRGFENHWPKQLSGGMQQRTAIARALANDPEILLLDEPFGALDPGVKLDMHELITGLWREHRLTILMVTHDIREAFKLGTRVIAFDKRRRDPQAPHRFGATAVYDFPLDKPAAQAGA